MFIFLLNMLNLFTTKQSEKTNSVTSKLTAINVFELIIFNDSETIFEYRFARITLQQ